jgi:transposase-like protein
LAGRQHASLRDPTITQLVPPSDYPETPFWHHHAHGGVYARDRVTLEGRKDVLGLWAGTGASAKFWMSVLLDMKDRGVWDVFFLVCDGLKGLPDVVVNVWPLTTIRRA